MKIMASSQTRAVRALVARGLAPDAEVAGRVAGIVDEVRRRGDRAVLKYARTFDRLEGPLELDADEIRRGAEETPPAVRAAIRTVARHIRRVSAKQMPRGWRETVAPGVVIEQRVTPLDRVGCYVPGGRHPLPSSLLMTAVPARAAGVPGSDRDLPESRPGDTRGGGRSERDAPVPSRRGARRRRVGVRHGDRPSRGQDRRPGKRLRLGRQDAGGARLRHRLPCRADRDRRRIERGEPGVDRGRPGGAGGARSGRPGDSADAGPAAGARGGRRGRRAARGAPGCGAVDRGARRRRRDAHARRGGRIWRTPSLPSTR